MTRLAEVMHEMLSASDILASAIVAKMSPTDDEITTRQAYALYGMKGLVHNDAFPSPDTELDEGDCLYHYRRGTHYLSRLDWNAYMDFIDKKTK